MSGKTTIEWTDVTWNPIRGCSRVSEGCRNCYAEKVAYRFSGERVDGAPAPFAGLVQRRPDGERIPLWNGQIRFVEEHLLDPLKWRTPRRVFVNSMSDLFHENVTDEMLDRIFAVMALAPQHTFQVLTKRPERMARYFNEKPGFQRFAMIVETAMEIGQCGFVHADGRVVFERQRAKMRRVPQIPLANVWLGVSVENQKAADERIPLLLQTPSAVRFLSCEPLLGPVSLQYGDRCSLSMNRLVFYGDRVHSAIDWVIVGGESGSGARPMHPDWARNLRDQCKSTRTPFFFKQWGEWLPDNQNAAMSQNPEPPASGTIRVGKKLAGRLLDGREWSDFPGVIA